MLKTLPGAVFRRNALLNNLVEIFCWLKKAIKFVTA
jgi:hypothetical protein